MRSPLARCSKFAWTVCLALLASCASTQGAKQSAESVFLDLWTSGDYGIAEKTLAPTYTWRENSRTGSGNEAYKAFVAGHREAFPDIAFEIKQTIAEGGMVMVRRISQGTHEGDPSDGQARRGERVHPVALRGGPTGGGVDDLGRDRHAASARAGRVDPVRAATSSTRAGSSPGRRGAAPNPVGPSA